MKNARYILPALGLFVFVSSAGSSANGKEPSRPNIILLMGDDHGWEEVGYNGHP